MNINVVGWRARAIAVTGGLLLSAAASALPQSYFSIVTVGDSLSDTGNLSATAGLPPAGVYYGDAAAFDGTGVLAADALRRYSNGPLWIERLESLLGGTPEFDSWWRDQFQQGTGGTSIDVTYGLAEGSIGPIESGDPIAGAQGLGANHAYAGAQTDGTLFGGMSLAQQAATIADFLQNGNAAFEPLTQSERDRSLFVVQGGGNDFFKILNPAQAPGVIEAAVDTIGTIIGDLAAAGASNFLVPNLPGYIVADDWVTATPADIRGLSQFFNGSLATKLEELRGDLGVEIVEVDWFALFDAVAADPGAYGLANVTDPCLDLSAGLGFEGLCGDPTRHMMFDALHPNSVMNQLMADAAYDAISAATVPLPAPVVLLLAGATLMLQRRRKE